MHKTHKKVLGSFVPLCGYFSVVGFRYGCTGRVASVFAVAISTKCSARYDRHQYDCGRRHSPAFVTRPRPGKGKKSRECQIFPKLMPDPSEQVIQQAGNTQDHQRLVLRSREQINQMRVECEEQECEPPGDTGTRPFNADQKEKQTASDKTHNAQQASRGTAPPQWIDCRQRRGEDVRQRKPHRSELP